MISRQREAYRYYCSDASRQDKEACNWQEFKKRTSELYAPLDPLESIKNFVPSDKKKTENVENVKEFCEMFYEVDVNAWVTCEAIYDRYILYCADENKTVCSKNAFGRAVKSLIGISHAQGTEQGVKRVYGVKRKEQPANIV